MPQVFSDFKITIFFLSGIRVWENIFKRIIYDNVIAFWAFLYVAIYIAKLFSENKNMKISMFLFVVFIHRPENFKLRGFRCKSWQHTLVPRNSEHWINMDKRQTVVYTLTKLNWISYSPTFFQKVYLNIKRHKGM